MKLLMLTEKRVDSVVLHQIQEVVVVQGPDPEADPHVDPAVVPDVDLAVVPDVDLAVVPDVDLVVVPHVDLRVVLFLIFLYQQFQGAVVVLDPAVVLDLEV